MLQIVSIVKKDVFIDITGELPLECRTACAAYPVAGLAER